MLRLYAMVILFVLLLPIAAFAQTPVTRDTEDAHLPGQYRQRFRSSINTYSCPNTLCSVISQSDFADIVTVLREVKPQMPYSTLRWLEIELAGGRVGYVIARHFDPHATTAAAVSAQDEVEIQEENVVSIRLTRGRQASHELIYSTFLRTVPNTASYSFRENLASGSLIFAEEGEYLVLFRSFIIANIDDYPYLSNSLEVERPRGSCRNIAVAEDNNAIVFLNCPGTVDFTYDTDGDYVSIFIFRIIE
ncbi:MAG: hypothetical protein OXF83_11395 [Anaerolineaceae bacterium]|nr:hypothetical protein [Anaerolineaceae bacterium]MCY3936332.1 hypothetical protein [Chloroflexota bacterium]MCY4010259.1 hypothetical protein [Anaerolineaceae bacterium]MCY4107262.1 hypothetical protein [Chloroflexota bacterium]